MSEHYLMELISQFCSCEGLRFDLVRIDLVRVDLVATDLMGSSCVHIFIDLSFSISFLVLRELKVRVMSKGDMFGSLNLFQSKRKHPTETYLLTLRKVTLLMYAGPGSSGLASFPDHAGEWKCPSSHVVGFPSLHRLVMSNFYKPTF